MPALGTDRKAELFQVFKPSPLCIGHSAALVIEDLVAENGERTPGGHFGIDLPQRTGGRVARVQPSLLALRRQLRVELLEVRIEEERLPADHQHIRDLARSRLDRDGERDGADRAHVRRDVLANDAIPAGHALNEDAVFIAEHGRQSVNLRLENEVRGFQTAVRLYLALKPGADVLFIERVRQAQHRRGMRHLGEFIRSRRARPHRRGIRRHPFRMRGLHLPQLHQQVIKLPVAHDRRIHHVVLVVVVIDRFLQLFVVFVCHFHKYPLRRNVPNFYILIIV